MEQKQEEKEESLKMNKGRIGDLLFTPLFFQAILASQFAA